MLENLILKQNALEELNIPVQTVYGNLGLYLLFDISIVKLNAKLVLWELDF